ncbi:hypothetical protein LMG28688_05835 [Paraburkholderia caffeinitolerans]|uniref:Uncharacterized protein n=1 Tax=Paraburkholderia caffeinitolerans TaxID=1723730 RepID=A0A6J5GML0_9BURK|nr:hypothetical protein LMG28688_05835 [Paraburkholderia caffeinitolerans]
MVAVKHDDLSMAFDFVSCASPMEHNAYVWGMNKVSAIFYHKPFSYEIRSAYIPSP